MQIADPLKSSLLAAKAARTERDNLERCLGVDLRAAVDHVATVCVASGLEPTKVEAVVYDWLGHCEDATGKDAAESKSIRLKAVVDGKSICVLMLSWFPGKPETSYESERAAGWRAGVKDWYLKHERSGYSTAVQAVDAALSDPHMAREVADVLVFLGA